MANHSSTVWDLVESNLKMECIDAHMTIAEALDYMKEKGLNTVALRCQPGTINPLFINDELIVDGEQYPGFISMLDLLVYVSGSYDPPKFLNKPVYYALGSSLDSMRMWIEPYTTPLNKVLKTLSSGCHHAIAFDTEGLKVSPKMLSQIDVISYLNRHAHTLGVKDILQTPLKDIMTEGCSTIKLTDSLKDSFLYLQRYRAMPVTDAEGRLITTLSSSDFTGHNWLSLASNISCSVVSYVLLRHFNSLPAPITLTPNATIQQAIDLILKNAIHRVYIVHDEVGNRVAGVVSCTDILRAFSEDRSI